MVGLDPATVTFEGALYVTSRKQCTLPVPPLGEIRPRLCVEGLSNSPRRARTLEVQNENRQCYAPQLGTAGLSRTEISVYQSFEQGRTEAIQSEPSTAVYAPCRECACGKRAVCHPLRRPQCRLTDTLLQQRSDVSPAFTGLFTCQWPALGGVLLEVATQAAPAPF